MEYVLGCVCVYVYVWCVCVCVYSQASSSSSSSSLSVLQSSTLNTANTEALRGTELSGHHTYSGIRPYRLSMVPSKGWISANRNAASWVTLTWSVTPVTRPSLHLASLLGDQGLVTSVRPR